MRTMLLCAAASALSLTACGKSTDDSAASTNTPVVAGTANTADAATAAAPSAQTFVETIAASDMFEIESGRLASTNATDTGLKAFGDMLVKDHTKSSADLKAAAGKATPALTVPAALPADLQAKLDALKAAKGEAFDTLFKTQQVEGHQNALATLQAYRSNGDQSSLTDFATKASPVVQQHLDKIKAM